MTLVQRTTTDLRQAQIHLGLPSETTPADVALACIRQAAKDVRACIEADPSIRLMLPVPVGFLQSLLSLSEEPSDG